MLLKRYTQHIWLVLFLLTSFCYTTEAQPIKQDTAKISKGQLVNIAYGTQPEWMVSGAISTVSGEKLQKVFTGNLGTALFGRIGGLTVMQQNNEPGLETPLMFGRGVGTYNEGREMLILVDGFESSYEHLSPYEIESISLLKDASATALYGSRGANGVLLITTKRGKVGPLDVSLNVQSGINCAFRLPEFLGAYDYARLYNEALANDNLPPHYTEGDLDKYKTGSSPYSHPDVDWYDEILRPTASMSSYNLNFSGGDKAIRYYGLLNVLSNNTLLIKGGDMSENSKNGNYTRYNFRTNVDADLTSSLTAKLTFAGSVEDKSNPAGNNTQSLFWSMATLPPNSFPVFNPNQTYGGTSLYTNPLGNVLETGHFTSNGRTLQATLQMTQDLDVIIKGLKLTGGISFNNFFRNYSNKTREYERYSLSGFETGDPVYMKYGQKTSLVGDESQSEQWRNLTVQGMINYARTFDAHSLDALVMYNSDNYSMDGVDHPFKHISVASRITYTNNKRYIGELSLSYMGSENFHKSSRFGLFPALSLGWIASSEDFLKENEIVNYLKLRGSYGLVGNDNIGGNRFMFDQYFVYSSSYYFGTGNTSSSSIEEGQLANQDISWEKDRKMNIGFDATLFNNLDVSFDLFRNDRYDILAVPNRTIPGLYGMTLPLLNEGEVRNKGFEVVLNYSKMTSADFQYFIGANISYAKNEIINMSEELRQFDYQYRTGLQVDQPFGLEAIGFFKNDADISASPRQIFTTVVPGDIKYKDQNYDNIIDVSDITSIGNPNVPVLTVGLTPGLKYKGLDFEMHLHAVSGRSSYLSGPLYHAFQNNGKITSVALDRWTESTAETADYPRLSADDNLNNYRYSSFWQKNGSFLKVRSLEFGYSLSDDLLKKLGVSKTRIFLNGTNLFSFDSLKHSDPEIISGTARYPSMRTLSMGINIGF